MRSRSFDAAAGTVPRRFTTTQIWRRGMSLLKRSSNSLPSSRDSAAKSRTKITDENIFLLIDESHRSHTGEFHNMMNDVLPNAFKIGFTGTPLLPGYISKMNLLMSAALAGGPFAMAGIIALLLSAILTAAYLLPMGIRAFLVTPEDSLSFTEHDRDPGWQMLVSFTVLVLTMLVLGIHAEPLMNALESLIMGSV